MLKRKKILKWVLYVFGFVLLLLIIGIIYVKQVSKIDAPVIKDMSSLKLQRTDQGNDFYTLKNNWFRKSKSGLFELYVEGDPFERGVINGKLTKELVVRQEEHFGEQIFKMVPSKFNRGFLKDLIGFFNRNLDPTRRYGSETSASFQATDTVLVRGGVALTRAVFREGAFAGQDVPLVSHFTANAGVTWNIWQNYLVFDATARYWSDRRMANDNANVQPVIPANATVDLKLSGVYDRYFWSASVNNLFDVKYYDYAVASSFTPGRFNAYPLPGRSFLVKAGVNF